MTAKELKEKISWILEQHEKTNHLYDGYLPYRFHLESVVSIGCDYRNLIPIEYWVNMDLALYGHDLIEDTRNTYNDVKEQLGEWVAEIIYRVTNEKGRNRKERQSDKYYAAIKESKEALFVKLCDRIANVSYSKSTKSRMLDIYRKEHPEFKSKLYTEGQYEKMWGYLNILLS